jgi:LPS export ABC transporter permease LptF
MKILRNYILKETAGPFLLSLAVLTFVMLLGNLLRLTDLIINKGVSILLVGKLFLLMIPMLLSFTIPIASLAAVLLAFGRLSSDNEITAIRVSGLNFVKLVIPLLVVAIILSLILVYLNDRVTPYVHYQTRQAVFDIGLKNPTAALEAGTFIDAFRDYVLFIYRIEGNKLYNIRLYQPKGQERKTIRTILAKSGEFVPLPNENKIKLKLINGTSDEPDINNPSNFYKLNFNTYFMTLSLSPDRTGKIQKKAKDMSLKELAQETQRLQSLNINPSPLVTEFHKKIAMSFSCFVFILLGCPLAIMMHRKEKMANLGAAFLIIASYYLLTIGAEALSIQNLLKPEIAMWIPNTILGVIGLGLNYKLCVS